MAANSKKTFFITTPIYYVNDIPHIGHSYTTVIADAISRFKKLAGYEVFFLTGTDEHGQKIEKAAAEKGLQPIELADRVVGRFKDLWKALNISYDFFIRTTQPFHEKGIQKLFRNLQEKGDIYKGMYRGYYCISDENFLSEDVPMEEDGLKICPDCGKKASLVEEACYFFRLSAYEKPLLSFYRKNPDFVLPKTRMNEVVRFVEQGLKDLSITRTTVKWGIPVPDDPKHTVYVWFDALNNYLTGIGYDWNEKLFSKFWPANLHLIGKDILRFHAVYWPAFLMAAEFPLPEAVFGHGWWLKDETKMSKSRGNVLDPYAILNVFGADPLRYFFLREVPIGLDANFSHEGFVHRVNSDLANDLGNLVQRTLTMIGNYFGGRLEEIGAEDKSDRRLREDFNVLKDAAFQHYKAYALNKALEDIWVYLNSVNRYLAEKEPWKLAKEGEKRKRLGRVLFQAAAAIRGISYLVYPVMPESTEKIWSCLGEEVSIAAVAFSEFKFEGLKLDRQIQAPQPLFPRVNLGDFLKEEARKPESAPSQIPKEEKMKEITFEEFNRLDLRVAEIVKAEKPEGAEKLLKLEIDLGTEKRQMVAGIAETYKPEDLVGKKLVVVANLEPAVIRGIESQAMLLAAVVNDKAVIPFFLEDVPSGTKVR